MCLKMFRKQRFSSVAQESALGFGISDDIPGSYLSQTVLWYCGHNHRAISHSYFIDLNNNPLRKWGAYHYTHNRVEKIETQEAFMIYRKPHSLELRT